MKDEELHGAKRGAVILATCIVQAIEEHSPGFQGRFLKKLEDAQYHLRDEAEGDQRNETEMLSWTRELLTGFTWGKGQEKPFLAK